MSCPRGQRYVFCNSLSRVALNLLSKSYIVKPLRCKIRRSVHLVLLEEAIELPKHLLHKLVNNIRRRFFIQSLSDFLHDVFFYVVRIVTTAFVKKLLLRSLPKFIYGIRERNILSNPFIGYFGNLEFPNCLNLDVGLQLNYFWFTSFSGTTPSIGRSFMLGLNLGIIGIVKGCINRIPNLVAKHCSFNFFRKRAHAKLNINAVMGQTGKDIRTFLRHDVDKNQVISAYRMRVNRNIR